MKTPTRKIADWAKRVDELQTDPGGLNTVVKNAWPKIERRLRIAEKNRNRKQCFATIMIVIMVLLSIVLMWNIYFDFEIDNILEDIGS